MLDDKTIKVQSETISLLRFPLDSAEGVCYLFGHGLRLFAAIAVPMFFMISGFLFFNNFCRFSWDGYKRKITNMFGFNKKICNLYKIPLFL